MDVLGIEWRIRSQDEERGARGRRGVYVRLGGKAQHDVIEGIGKSGGMLMARVAFTSIDVAPRQTKTAYIPQTAPLVPAFVLQSTASHNAFYQPTVITPLQIICALPATHLPGAYHLLLIWIILLEQRSIVRFRVPEARLPLPTTVP